MKILVTGGAGFIGSNLVRHLCSFDNYKVRVLDNLSSGRLDNFKQARDKIDFIKGDILENSILCKAMKDVDYVFHMAAMASVDDSVKRPLENHMVNALGTLNVLNAAKESGVKRLIYSSSASVYGNPSQCPLIEDANIDPLSPYALQKYSGERYAIYFTKYYGFETICLRYFNVYGPYQQENGGYAGVIFRFFSDGIKKGFLNIEGEGKQTRDFIFVEDVVKANMLAMNSESGCCGEAYNVGTGLETSISDLAKEVVKVLDEKIDIRHVEPRPEEISRSCADLFKIKSALGFKPSVNLFEGLSKTYEWIRDFR